MKSLFGTRKVMKPIHHRALKGSRLRLVKPCVQRRKRRVASQTRNWLSSKVEDMNVWCHITGIGSDLEFVDLRERVRVRQILIRLWTETVLH